VSESERVAQFDGRFSYWVAAQISFVIPETDDIKFRRSRNFEEIIWGPVLKKLSGIAKTGKSDHRLCEKGNDKEIQVSSQCPVDPPHKA
jgi:hypothetical protein